MNPLPRTFRAGEFIGYRIWELHAPDGILTLRSWVYPCWWLPGCCVADISHEVNGDNGPIGDYNERGVWAFANETTRDQEFMNYYHVNSNIVWGTVFMWGTVIEHTKGYRSQYARVRTIDRVDGASEGDLEFLRNRYQV